MNLTKLMYFIELLEKSLGKKAIKEFHPIQPGDLITTASDTSALKKWVDFLLKILNLIL